MKLPIPKAMGGLVDIVLKRGERRSVVTGVITRTIDYEQGSFREVFLYGDDRQVYMLRMDISPYSSQGQRIRVSYNPKHSTQVDFERLEERDRPKISYGVEINDPNLEVDLLSE